ncbi:MAG: hypothetical protein JWP81_2068 [Ferruginibacter sp.]|nr:hypothetical protein [Ferruginibacter sp.]
MKIEQLIVQYLYLNKQVTLQGIGTFKLDPSVILPAENDKDKDFAMPENAFLFEYNLKAEEDGGLVKYIVDHTNKILPLASADLDSYVMLAKQFLNIGKPLVIEGLGTVQKKQQGYYEFIPGHFIYPKIDDIPKQAREKRDESVSFESESKPNNSRRNLLVGIIAVVIVLGGLGIYYMLMDKKASESDSATIYPSEAKADSTLVDTLSSSTTDTTLKVATPIVTTPPDQTDSNTFKIVLKNYASRELADKAFKRLSTYGHKLLVIKVDSFQYQLAIPFNSPLSDTLRAKDSLRKFFGGKPYVKL